MNKPMRKQQLTMIAALSVAIIACWGFIILMLLAVNATGKDETYPIDLSQFESEYITYDGTWHVEEGQADPGDSATIRLLRGPYTSLSKGDYTVTVTYKADSLQYIKAYSDKDNADILASFTRLEALNTSTTFSFRATKDIEDFELVVLYTGQGDFEITGMSISQNYTAPYTRALCVWVFVFASVGILFMLRKRLKQSPFAVIGVLAAFACSSLPLFFRELAAGHDTLFHAIRIEGMAQAMAEGQFPVRMEDLWLFGYGYASEIYYGDLFLYLPAFLRIMGFSLTEAIRIYFMGINLATAIITYASFKSIFTSRRAAFISTLAYTCSMFRFVDIYVRCTVGETCALMFLPLAAAGFIKILNLENIKSPKEYFTEAAPLAIAMSGLIYSHLLTTEGAVIFLGITALVFAKKFFRKEVLLATLTAVLETCLLSAAFVVPFLDYSSKITTRINVWMLADSSRHIQSDGASLLSYIKFWGNFFGYGRGEDKMTLTPGILLIAGLLASIVLWICRKANTRIKYCTIMSLLTLFMASDIFPWDFLEDNLFFGPAIASIQFPWRLIGIALIFMSITLGECIRFVIATSEKHADTLSLVALLVTILISVAMLNSYLHEGTFGTEYYDAASLNVTDLGDNEYLMTGADTGNLDYDITTDGKTYVEYPIFNYPYYRATDSEGNELTIETGDNCRIRVLIPDNFQSEIHIEFQEPALWRVAELISLISACGVTFLLVRHRTKY